MYSSKQVCEILGISSYTFANWYRWERKEVNKGCQPYLPEPIRASNERGKPRYWSDEMLDQLKEFQSNIVVGRNGKYGEYSNPYHFETKKYKEEMEAKNDGQ